MLQSVRSKAPAASAGVLAVGFALLMSSTTVYSPVKSSRSLSTAAGNPGMATERGTRLVESAIKDIEVEKIQGPGDSATAQMSSFWEGQPVVIHVLRRFGCQLCRGHAVELSKIIPQLEANNVRVVGIGIQKLGLEEFQDGGYWKSELYIDNGKKIHKSLELRSVGVLSSVKMLLANKEVKEAIQKTKDTPGNFKGDGRQLGATFVLAKGGETLLDFRQRNFGDQPSNAAILEALGLRDSDGS